MVVPLRHEWRDRSRSSDSREEAPDPCPVPGHICICVEDSSSCPIQLASYPTTQWALNALWRRRRRRWRWKMYQTTETLLHMIVIFKEHDSHVTVMWWSCDTVYLSDEAERKAEALAQFSHHHMTGLLQELRDLMAEMFLVCPREEGAWSLNDIIIVIIKIH